MKKLAFLDTESNGLNKPRLLQLAYAIGNGQVVTQLFRPEDGVGIEAGATEKHKLTIEQLQYFETVEQSREQLQKILHPDTTIIVAHNASFDLRVLHNEQIETGDSIDTVKIARRLWPQFKNHKLGFLADMLGIEHGELHQAANDVLVLRELFKRMLLTIIAKDPMQSRIITKMIEYTKKKADQDIESLPPDNIGFICDQILNLTNEHTTSFKLAGGTETV